MIAVGGARFTEQDEDNGAERPRLDREPSAPALPGRRARHPTHLPGTFDDLLAIIVILYSSTRGLSV